MPDRHDIKEHLKERAEQAEERRVSASFSNELWCHLMHMHVYKASPGGWECKCLDCGREWIDEQ